MDADAAVRYALCACLLYTVTATTAACYLVLLCVGSMGDSDSESDFELHAVKTLEDGFSDPPSDVPSEEPATEDDVGIGSDTDTDGADVDGAEIPDADGDNNDGKANNGTKGKKRKRVTATDLAFRLRVCRRFHQCNNKKQTARKFKIQPKQVRDYLNLRMCVSQVLMELQQHLQLLLPTPLAVFQM